MKRKIILGVYRRFDNSTLELSEESKIALELHNKRKIALEEVFEQTEPLEVKNWGQTKDEKSHEFVEIILGVVSTTVFNYAIVPGLKFIGEKLVEKAIDEATSESVKWIISKLRPKQVAKKILDFHIELPDGTKIFVDPPDRGASIKIHFKDGQEETIKYDN